MNEKICFYDNSRYGVGGGTVAYNLVEYGVAEGDAGEDGAVKREHVDPLQDLLDEVRELENSVSALNGLHRFVFTLLTQVYLLNFFFRLAKSLLILSKKWIICIEGKLGCIKLANLLIVESRLSRY